MTTCSIQQGGKRHSRRLRRAGTRSRRSYRGGEDINEDSVAAPNSIAENSESVAAPDAAQESGFFSGMAKSLGDFTNAVEKRAKDGYYAVTGSNSSEQPSAPAADNMSSEQSGGRRKKSKTARKSRKSYRLKRKRSRKSRK